LVISTLITGGALWLVAGALGFFIPLPLALLFGALIAPTDPVAVLAIMRQVGASERMSIKITGESLLNDGVAVVVFVALIGTVTSGTPPHATELALFLAQEVLGAIVLGAAVGFAGYRLLRGVDDYLTETLITLAVAMAGYSLGETAGVSAPITVVTAGLIIGSRGRKYAMSGNTRARVDSFWALVDYVLNAALFVLMGLEVLAVPFGDVPGRGGWIALLAIPVTLLARLVSVALPVIALGARRRFERGTIPVLTWGGLKGGVSMALALAVPDTGHRDFVLTATYAVVLFSIFVQGLTVRRLVARYVERD
jgi:CPA1 family monovalent cation:H+ antiporter